MTIYTKENMIDALDELFWSEFDKYWNSNALKLDKSTNRSTYPKTNIYKSDSELIMLFEFPAYINKSDINLKIDQDKLEISGKLVPSVDKYSKFEVVKKELKHSSFKRVFQLDIHILDTDKLDAKMVQGQLEITIPFKESTKSIEQKRQIQIK